MTKPYFSDQKPKAFKSAASAPRLLLLGISLCLLPACAVVNAPANPASVFDGVQTSQGAAQTSSFMTASQDGHYKFETRSKFESLNPLYANLGRGDDSVNTAYIQNRNAMAQRPVREDARSRFAPKPHGSKLPSDTSLNTFLNTYSETPPATFNQKGTQNNFPAYELSKFEQNGISADTSSTDNTDSTEIAFVNVNGQTDTRDWEACARENQGVFDQSAVGFKLKESFSTCMLSRGYQPEEEAVETMMSKPVIERADETPIATYPSLRGFTQVETYTGRVKSDQQPKPYSDVLAGGF